MNANTALQDRLSHRFRDGTLLTLALTHSSATGTGAAKGTDYERLEFLGDRVLGLLVAERLYALYPDEPEGDLSKRHTALVRAETLASMARTLGLPDVILLSTAEKQGGGTDNDNILSDVMEAVIGAVYLDGGLDAAKKALLPLLESHLNTMTAPPRDAKTALQEWAQARAMGLPEYVLVSRDGPDHAPDFTVTVRLPGFDAQTANGASKRAAEKAAAERLLAIVEKTA